ncbi:MAG: thiamine-phosphate kinase [Candidatus Omnitrophica bacterium]|nr:thiamine-phosphate kinase [Candidatus Omnitrophota bacterium]
MADLKRVKDIGEFGLIKVISEKIKLSNRIKLGIGDDCAVLPYNRTHYQLLSCDMIVEGVDFTSNCDPRLIGRKALAVCISDIASCGGLPKACLVSLALPEHTPIKTIDRLYDGMLEIAQQYNVEIVGGDISKLDRLAISVSISGLVRRRHLALRSMAKPGDILFSSGPFGGSIKGKHLSFTPRLQEAQYLVRNYQVHAMIDVSDGLLQDLNHILEASKVGVFLYEELIPWSTQCENLWDALTSGEDFELLFTLPLREARRLRKTKKNFFVLGQIMPASFGMIMIDRFGRKIRLKPQGFSHF